MKCYFLLGCIVAITPIMQSVSANAADLGLAPAPSAPYVPRTFNWSPPQLGAVGTAAVAGVPAVGVAVLGVVGSGSKKLVAVEISSSIA